MIVKKDAPKPKLIGLRMWSKAIPQFNVGHQDLLQVGFLSTFPGISTLVRRNQGCLFHTIILFFDTTRSFGTSMSY